MFGYVTIGKNHLTQEEYDVFSSYYCGVCKATGKYASQPARVGLSYDITFLALVLSALSQDGNMHDSRCIIHPVKKCKVRSGDGAVEYAALVGVILSYLKLADDWHDEHSIKALLGMAVFYGGFRKARKRLPTVYDVIKCQLDILSELEKNNSNSIDDTSEAFAKILEAVMSPEFITDSGTRRILGWLGYNLGRWIYVIDAVNDFEKDRKSKSYNPFVSAGYTDSEKCAGDNELGLTLTLDGIASAFELLDVKRNKEIIGKIIYIGLKEKQDLILGGNDKRSNTKKGK